MKSMNYAITFACYNQIEYTRQCVESLIKTGVDLSRVIAVDNGSTDGTQAYLQSLPLGGVILNNGNLGCGVAWNQGALALQAEWTIVMNNDVVCTQGWLEGLISTAEQQGLKVVSPAMVEGPLDYDLDAFTADALNRVGRVLRVDRPHAVCMAIHQSVWMDVGYFLAIPRLFGLEDAVFFKQVRDAGVPAATIGASWLHHYGSVTQSAMKAERRLSAKSGLGDQALYRQLMDRSWLQRKWDRFLRKRIESQGRQQELSSYGMTLLGARNKQEFVWR